jgi:hypothetical protein
MQVQRNAKFWGFSSQMRCAQICFPVLIMYSHNFKYITRSHVVFTELMIVLILVRVMCKSVRFEVFMAMIMSVMLQIVAPCSNVAVFQCYRTHCLHYNCHHN